MLIILFCVNARHFQKSQLPHILEGQICQATTCMYICQHTEAETDSDKLLGKAKSKLVQVL
jgi:hypothetical protein